MFATSTHSYAMMNAPESVKQHARYLAPSNDDLGVVRVLREIGIAF
jgi:hydroxymethylpyrimidine pyrophosphatase-like HAD family hydrolase